MTPNDRTTGTPDHEPYEVAPTFPDEARARVWIGPPMLLDPIPQPTLLEPRVYEAKYPSAEPTFDWNHVTTGVVDLEDGPMGAPGAPGLPPPRPRAASGRPTAEAGPADGPPAPTLYEHAPTTGPVAPSGAIRTATGSIRTSTGSILTRPSAARSVDSMAKEPELEAPARAPLSRSAMALVAVLVLGLVVLGALIIAQAVSPPPTVMDTEASVVPAPVIGLDGLPLPTPQPGHGYLLLTSDPSPGAVHVDGVNHGLTPLAVELPTGRRHVEVRVGGYDVARPEITITEDHQSHHVTLIPRPTEGPVQVSARDWEGAELFVDGEPVGTVPLTLTLKDGEHTFELRRDGERLQRDEDVWLVRDEPFQVDLTPR